MSRAGRVIVFGSPEEAADHAARALVEAAARAAKRRAALALPGGSTPVVVFRRLLERHREAVPWTRIEVFFGDERAVPPDHADSNYRLAREGLLQPAGVPPDQVHRMAAEEADLDAAARRYEEEVRERVPAGPDGLPAFDLIWLGVGEDGHTASLFPGSPVLEERERLVAPTAGPRGGARRLTFTLPLLEAARRVQCIVLGKRKAAIARRLLEPGPRQESHALPAGRLALRQGELEWLLDREAAADLTTRGEPELRG